MAVVCKIRFTLYNFLICTNRSTLEYMLMYSIVKRILVANQEAWFASLIQVGLKALVMIILIFSVPY